MIFKYPDAAYDHRILRKIVFNKIFLRKDLIAGIDITVLKCLQAHLQKSFSEAYVIREKPGAVIELVHYLLITALSFKLKHMHSCSLKLPETTGKKIATSYPAILKQFLDKHGIQAEIHVITGSVEISPGIGLADGIFDIVSSGSTLVSNNLREVEVVMQSEALLIGNKQLSAEKREILEQMLFRFKAVKDAEDKKYVRMNAPKARLQEIIDVLPGLKSPTIIPLADDEWCSVHTVLDQKQFWEIIGKLKEMGAQGILVTPIEKMIL